MSVNFLGPKKVARVEAIVGEKLDRVCLYSHGMKRKTHPRTYWFYTADGLRCGTYSPDTGEWSIRDMTADEIKTEAWKRELREREQTL